MPWGKLIICCLPSCSPNFSLLFLGKFEVHFNFSVGLILRIWIACIYWLQIKAGYCLHLYLKRVLQFMAYEGCILKQIGYFLITMMILDTYETTKMNEHTFFLKSIGMIIIRKYDNVKQNSDIDLLQRKYDDSPLVGMVDNHSAIIKIWNTWKNKSGCQFWVVYL